ncbi:MAG: hypothetical protein WC857_00590 [Candidatus Paceibacterota bacterium]|jgi:hypothetical protein
MAKKKYRKPPKGSGAEFLARLDCHASTRRVADVGLGRGVTRRIPRRENLDERAGDFGDDEKKERYN